MKYIPYFWSVIIHGGLALLWYYYSGLIIKFESALNQHWIVSVITFILGIALFAFLYVKITPKKYNYTIGWFLGFFPVLFVMMFIVT